MTKAVVVATTAYMIAQFNMSDIYRLKKMNYDVVVAANFESPGPISIERLTQLKDDLNLLSVKFIQINFSRKPFSINNFIAFKQLSAVITNDVKIVHSHTPIAGAISRLATMRKKTVRRIYTAHGFHFFKGASIKNWLTFYPIEKFFSYFTDDLITINSEDFQLAKKSFHAKRLHYVNGVGIDLKKFDADKKKVNLNKKQTKLKLISIGELNKNKNHRLVIEAIHQSKFKDCFSYDICGEGTLKEELTQLIKQYGLENQVRLLGYRDDVHRLLAESDTFVFPSFREGLPVSVMEAMATGLPVLASDIRGNHDLVVHEKGGFLFESGNVEDLVHYLEECFMHQENMIAFGDYNLQKIQEYSSDYVDSQMREIYSFNSKNLK
ncbi:glycosyltransferase family 4 protein [Streptococcus intermedius]